MSDPDSEDAQRNSDSIPAFNTDSQASDLASSETDREAFSCSSPNECSAGSDVDNKNG